jgi:hypothetical protein
MKINGKHEVLAQIARRGFALVGFLTMALICASPGRAQSSATTASAQDAQPAAAPTVPKQTPATTAKPESAPAKAAESSEEKPPAKGAKEGIVVHGHWTIVVKNPDGTVAARQEFENALDPVEGADLLTGLLSGSYTTEGFLIDLNSAAGTLCGFSDCTMYDSRVQGVCSSFQTAFTCGTLTYAPNTTTAHNNAVGFTLNGNVTLLQTDGGTINGVSTGIAGCVPGLSVVTSGLFNAGVSDGNGAVTNAAAVTSLIPYPPGRPSGGATCIGAAGFVSQILFLTSRAITQPVTGGQSVAVTVVITFSGS